MYIYAILGQEQKIQVPGEHYITPDTVKGLI